MIRMELRPSWYKLALLPVVVILGEYGVYLISRGLTQPYRLRIRSSSFCNLSALKHMTVGHYVADAPTERG